MHSRDFELAESGGAVVCHPRYRLCPANSEFSKQVALQFTIMEKYSAFRVWSFSLSSTLDSELCC